MTVLGMEIGMPIVWLVLAVIFLAVEALTVGLTTIWFAAGSFSALLLAMFSVPVTIQVIVFLVVSCALLVFTRKIFVEKLKTGSESTNVDAIIGKIGQVTTKIEPHKVGQVRLNGQGWSAICKDDIVIDENTLVKVIAIEGVKLIVVPEKEN